MKKLIFINILIFLSITYAQTFQIEKLSGSVKILNGSDNSWHELKANTRVESNAIISTDKNSFVYVKEGERLYSLTFNIRFTDMLPSQSL